MFFSLQQYQNQLFQQTEDVDGKTEIIIKVSSSYFMKSPLFFVVLHVKIQRCVGFFFLTAVEIMYSVAGLVFWQRSELSLVGLMLCSSKVKPF